MIVVTAFEAPAVVTGFDDVAMVGQPVEQRGGHLGIAEHAEPFAEGEIGGDDDGKTLVEPLTRWNSNWSPDRAHEPSTHDHLVELYEFLIPGDPAGVFDALHALLTGPAAREGYHHESLAAPVIVRMITRYIANHRSIFEDDTRRARRDPAPIFGR